LAEELKKNKTKPGVPHVPRRKGRIQIVGGEKVRHDLKVKEKI